MTIFEYIRLSSEDDDLKEGEKPESTQSDKHLYPKP